MKNKFKENLSAELIIQIYKRGVFPMARSRFDNEIHFVNPKKRALLPIKNFHVSKSFSRLIKKKPFFITVNKNFKKVINKCATENRTDTWINKTIEKQFYNLHKIGVAHSIECWKNNEIVGGIYGVALGGCFFAESMFSSVNNASKFALINLVARLYLLQYSVLDVQFMNDHLKQFGAYEIAQDHFIKKINEHINHNIDFQSLSLKDEDLFDDVLTFLQEIKETS